MMLATRDSCQDLQDAFAHSFGPHTDLHTACDELAVSESIQHANKIHKQPQKGVDVVAPNEANKKQNNMLGCLQYISEFLPRFWLRGWTKWGVCLCLTH